MKYKGRYTGWEIGNRPFSPSEYKQSYLAIKRYARELHKANKPVKKSLVIISSDYIKKAILSRRKFILGGIKNDILRGVMD